MNMFSSCIVIRQHIERREFRPEGLTLSDRVSHVSFYSIQYEN